MKWKIGDLEIKNQIVLAPMAGISNPAYIKIASEMGCGLAYTELISAEAIIRNNKKTIEMLKGIDTLDIPVGVQLFGSNPKTMAQAAQIITNLYNIKLIDINMGCPVPKVAVKAKSGSALLKDIPKVKEIVKSVSEAISIPVTVKIRSGWDNNSINAIIVAQAIEESGAKAITIHGRTRSQGYSGTVDYNIIKKVKQNVSIPVIGNGDITDIESAKKMFSTGVNAIMIGRKCLGNPWIIRDLVNYFEHNIEPYHVNYKEKIEMCFHHMNYLLEIKSEKVTVLEMRSHISWYLKGLPDNITIKNQIFKATSISEIKTILEKYLNELDKKI